MKTNENYSKVKKVFKTADNTILIVKATTERCGGRKYVSVTADEIKPLLYSDAVDITRESLEDGDLWKQSVNAGSTELGLADWVDYVINNDGYICGIDKSLYPDQININNEDYIFESISCGCLHDEIKQATNLFNELIKLHLKDDEKSIKEAEVLINSIDGDDIDKKILEIAKEIIETNN